MRHSTLQILTAGLLAVSSLAVLAQPGPHLDPGFLPAEISQPAQVRSVIALAGGAQLVIADSYSNLRAGGQAVNGLIRYLPSGQLDQAFASQVANYRWTPLLVEELSNGKLLVQCGGTAQLGSISRASLVRLNADGSPDPTFQVGTGGIRGQLHAMAAQADGKVLVGGRITAVGGQLVNRLARLNADGSLDAAFQAQGTGADGPVLALLVQPDGKIVVGGDFNNLNSRPAPSVTRLESDGSADFTFNANASASGSVVGLARQPDGKLLLAAGTIGSGVVSGAGPNRRLVRVLPTGALDASFTGGQTSIIGAFSPFYPAQLLQVLANGSILVASDGRVSPGSSPVQTPFLRLTPTGAPDPTFQAPTAPPAEQQLPLAFTALPSGQVLLSGGSLRTGTLRFAGGPDRPVALARLQASGSYDAGFEPELEVDGEVNALARQADGSLLVGGLFSKINGTPASCLARLLPSGVPDAAYARQANANAQVLALALQPDGRLLVGGSFTAIGGTAQTALARLQPTGLADAGFSPPIRTLYGAANITQIALQPDGKALLLGNFGLGTTATFGRVLPNGLADASFQPSQALQDFHVRVTLAQPDGTILVGVRPTNNPTTTPRLQRLLADGTVDPAFTPLPGIMTNGDLTALARLADGSILGAEMNYDPTTGTSSSDVFKLQPNGVPQASFGTGGFFTIPYYAYITRILPQPNGRILLTGDMALTAPNDYVGVGRLLASGSLDPDFDLSQVPSYLVADGLIQPDGALVFGGSFTTVGGLPVIALARMLDSNVLTVRNQQAGARTTAWPVPARDVLHLALDAASRPQQVQLLDALGRVVCSRPVQGPDLSLPTAGLAPGSYLLRVSYAEGPVTRRIVVE